MKKVVLKLDFADEKVKLKAMKKVSGLTGLESIALDAKDKKLTVTGDVDPVKVVGKLRKICFTEIVSVGSAKEPEKKKEEPKKEEPKKEDDKKKEEDKKREEAAAQLLKAYQAHYQQQQQYYYQQAVAAPPSYFNRSVEEDPNGCVIC